MTLKKQRLEIWFSCSREERELRVQNLLCHLERRQCCVHPNVAKTSVWHKDCINKMFLGNENWKYEELAKEYNRSQERIRQMFERYWNWMQELWNKTIYLPTPSIQERIETIKNIQKNT